MGFLNFLKKEKKADNDLDLPPPPPSLEEHNDLPEFPELDDSKEFDFSKEMDIKMPEFDHPQIDEPSMDIEPVSGDMDQDFEFDEADSQKQVPASKYREYEMPKAKSTIKTSHSFYVKVDDFRLMLGTMGSIRMDLRKSEEGLVRLENMKVVKDKSFDKIKASLEDVQKKLIFIDKTLFKGE